MFTDLLRFELSRSCRRRSFLVYRWIYAAWLVVVFVVCYGPRGAALWSGFLSPAALFDVGGFSFIGFVLWQRLALIVLVTPLFVAGQITDEKQRGVLQFTFLTEIEGWQIILSKLLAQGLLLASLLLLDLPLLLVATAFEDYSALGLLTHTAAMLIVVFTVGAASLLLAVWCRTTRGVLLVIALMAIVLGAGAWLLHEGLTFLAGGATTGWASRALGVFELVLDCTHPSYLAEVAEGHGQFVQLAARLLVFSLVWGGLGAGFATLASRQLRSVYLKQLENAGRESEVLLIGQRRVPVSDDPVYWRERYLEGIAPPGLLRFVPTWLGLLLTATITALLVHLDCEVIGALFGGAFLVHGILIGAVLGLLVGLRACTAMVAERQRQTFDLLMLTGWTYGQTVDSACRGILRAYVPYLVCYSGVALATAAFHGPETMLGAAMAAPLVWQVVLWCGLCGLESSRGETSLWRGLFATAITSATALFVVGYAWAFLVVLSVGSMRISGQKLEVIGGMVALIALAGPVSVLAPYAVARLYFLRLEWKPGMTREYKAALRQAELRYRRY